VVHWYGGVEKRRVSRSKYGVKKTKAPAKQELILRYVSSSSCVRRAGAEDAKSQSVLVAPFNNKVIEVGSESKAQKIVHKAFDVWLRRTPGWSQW
jgi:hypothetical protein